MPYLNVSLNDCDLSSTVEMTEIPSKCITTTRPIHLKANIQLIELEGRCDGESLLRVVSQSRPRAIVGLRAGPNALKVLG